MHISRRPQSDTASHPSKSGLSSIFHINIVIGEGCLYCCEKAGFYPRRGKYVRVLAIARAALQVDYANPVFRVGCSSKPTCSSVAMGKVPTLEGDCWVPAQLGLCRNSFSGCKKVSFLQPRIGVGTGFESEKARWGTTATWHSGCCPSSASSSTARTSSKISRACHSGT